MTYNHELENYHVIQDNDVLANKCAILFVCLIMKLNLKFLMIHKWSIASVQNHIDMELMLKLLEMRPTTCLKSSLIYTEGNLKVPSHFIASFRPLVSTSLGRGRPLYHADFDPMNSPRSPLKHKSTP